MAHPTAGPLFASFAGQTMAAMDGTSEAALGVDVARVMASMPLSRLAAFGALSRETLDEFLERVGD